MAKHYVCFFVTWWLCNVSCM